MLRWLQRRPNVDAEGIAGNVVIGDVNGTLVQNILQGAETTQPTIGWRDLPAQEDVFRLLSWRTRLTKLYGRDVQKAELTRWAEAADKVPQVRLLCGPGGAGKSRLAAEVADNLRHLGWTAGFHRLDRPAGLPVTAKGLFLVVDYPEEAREATVALLRELTTQEGLAAPLCLLLVTRQPATWWQPDIDRAHAAHLCDALEVGIATLNESDTVALMTEAARRVAER